MDNQYYIQQNKKIDVFKILALISITVNVIFFILIKKVEIPPIFYIIIVVLGVSFLIIQYKEKNKILLSEKKMVDIIIKDANKRNYTLNSYFKNIISQQIGINQYAVTFIDENLTFIFQNGQLTTKNYISIPEHKQDIERLNSSRQISKKEVDL